MLCWATFKMGLHATRLSFEVLTQKLEQVFSDFALQQLIILEILIFNFHLIFTVLHQFTQSGQLI